MLYSFFHLPKQVATILLFIEIYKLIYQSEILNKKLPSHSEMEGNTYMCRFLWSTRNYKRGSTKSFHFPFHMKIGIN